MENKEMNWETLISRILILVVAIVGCVVGINEYFNDEEKGIAEQIIHIDEFGITHNYDFLKNNSFADYFMSNSLFMTNDAPDFVTYKIGTANDIIKDSDVSETFYVSEMKRVEDEIGQFRLSEEMLEKAKISGNDNSICLFMDLYKERTYIDDTLLCENVALEKLYSAVFQDVKIHFFSNGECECGWIQLYDSVK